MNVLGFFFLLIWIVVGFFALRYLAQQYFHEDRRADAAATLAVATFVIGILLPSPLRTGGSTRPASGETASSTASAAPAPACHSPSPCQPIVHGLKPSVGMDKGNVDSVRPELESDNPATVYRAGCNIYLNGWALDAALKRPLPGILVVIDGKRVVNATSAYGQNRPDIVQAFGVPGVLRTGFLHAEVPTTGLRPGQHTLQLAGISQDRKSYHFIGSPTPFTIQ